MIGGDEDITLSILIPSYNRGDLLIKLLNKLDQESYLPFNYEVVVTDNASEDPLYDQIKNYNPRNYSYRYYRHEKNIGAVRNIFSAFRLARGIFSLHLCDDDEIIPETVSEIVGIMKGDESIGASFAIFRAIHVPTQKLIHEYYFDKGFYDKNNAQELAFVLAEAKTPMPENAICRTDAAVDVLFETVTCRYVYVVLARFMAVTGIYLHDKPYYLLCSDAGTDVIESLRESEKFDFIEWDMVSRGFNLFYYWSTGHRSIQLNDGPSKTACAQFLREGFYGAQDKKQFRQAAELMLHVNSMTDVDMTTPAMRKNLIFLSNLDTVFQTLSDSPIVDTLIIVGFGEEISSVIKEYIFTRGIGIAHKSLVSLGGVTGERYAYLTPSDAMRSSVLHITGAVAGAVFSMESLTRVFDLVPRSAA